MAGVTGSSCKMGAFYIENDIFLSRKNIISKLLGDLNINTSEPIQEYIKILLQQLNNLG